MLKILKTKVGILTIDEAVHAGLSINVSSNSYIKRSNNYWLLDTLCNFWLGKIHGAILENGKIDINVDEEYYVYPVISLRTDTLVVGSGTEADPYVVQTR